MGASRPGYTGDLDVWVMVDPANVDRLLAGVEFVDCYPHRVEVDLAD